MYLHLILHVCKCSAKHGYRLKYDIVHRWWKHLSLRRNIKYTSMSSNNIGLFLTLNAISVLPVFLLNSGILSCSNFNYIRTVQLMKDNEIHSAWIVQCGLREETTTQLQPSKQDVEDIFWNSNSTGLKNTATKRKEKDGPALNHSVCTEPESTASTKWEMSREKGGLWVFSSHPQKRLRAQSAALGLLQATTFRWCRVTNHLLF